VCGEEYNYAACSHCLASVPAIVEWNDIEFKIVDLPTLKSGSRPALIAKIKNLYPMFAGPNQEPAFQKLELLDREECDDMQTFSILISGAGDLRTPLRLLEGDMWDRFKDWPGSTSAWIQLSSISTPLRKETDGKEHRVYSLIAPKADTFRKVGFSPHLLCWAPALINMLAIAFDGSVTPLVTDVMEPYKVPTTRAELREHLGDRTVPGPLVALACLTNHNLSNQTECVAKSSDNNGFQREFFNSMVPTSDAFLHPAPAVFFIQKLKTEDTVPSVVSAADSSAVGPDVNPVDSSTATPGAATKSYNTLCMPPIGAREKKDLADGVEYALRLNTFRIYMKASNWPRSYL
jgi:hypothetical protein